MSEISKIVRLSPQGPSGPAPTLTVGTVTTGAPGSQVVVQITGTAPSYTVNLTIPAGAAGSDASVTATNVAAAIAAMSDAQVTALLVKLGFTTYGGLSAGNAALNIGDVFRDSSDSNKFKAATA